MATLKYKDANGEWHSINNQVIDSKLSNTSTNPVQNKTIKEAIDNIQDKLTFDEIPIKDSGNLVTSGVIYNLGVGFDSRINSVATELGNELNNKQEQLTFDEAPTEGSKNPVTSGGVYTALSNIPSGGTTAEAYELIEEITVSEEAVVERRYTQHYKKLIIRAYCAEKLPKFRLFGGSWFAEFYSFSNYANPRALYIGEIIIPNMASETRCLTGAQGGNPTEGYAITERAFGGAYFDGFKTDAACYVGTSIQVYGVKSNEN